MWIYLMFLPLCLLLLSVLLPSFWGGAWSPTPMRIVHQMLDMAKLQEGETLYDLGAGDGRVIFKAVSDCQAKAVGVEIDPFKCFLLKTRIRYRRLGESVKVIKSDFFKVNLSDANVVFLYLSPVAHHRLQEKLSLELKEGSRVVCYRRTMEELPLEAVNLSENLFMYRIGQNRMQPIETAT
jgi:ubiquinone/menaquinone biosynthesis C-methylase UbiE